MQEKVQTKKQELQSLSQIYTIKQIKQRLKCLKNNPAYVICNSSECLNSGLICSINYCQCQKLHQKCNLIYANRVLSSIEKHQIQIPMKVKETYQTIYEMINYMIEKLQKMKVKFKKEELSFCLKQEEIQFLNMINTQKIEINGKFISYLEKTFDIPKQFQIELNIKSKEDMIKDFQQKKKQFDKICKSIQENYLLNKNTQQEISIFLEDSKIVETQQEKEIMRKWTSQSFNSKVNLKSQLLFRASQHNFRASAFHSNCDGIRDTLVIVKNEFDRVIGGFTSQSWASSNGTYTKDVNNKAFMFSLTLKQKYKCIQPQNSIFGNSSNGPMFGDGNQLIITDKYNYGPDSYSNFGKSYNLQINNQNKYQYNTQQTFTLITGAPEGNQFKIKQYEVYHIK